MKKIAALCLSFVLVLGIFGGTAPLQASALEPDFEVAANGVYLVNTDTNTVVYEKNGDQRMVPASLTKIMTAVIALCNIEDLDKAIVTAPGYIYDEFYGLNVSNAEIARGEVFTMRELLYALMLNSACEAASIIADYVGDGSIEYFAQMMNDKAKEIGAVNTNFTNAHGLYDENQYTTPHDMYLITQYAMQLPGFMEIASTKNYTIEGNEDRTTKNLVHTNKMLFTTNDYYMPEISGIKTGTLEEAGRCLITTAESEGYHYVCVVMGAPYDVRTSSYEATQNLYNWAFDTFRVKTLLDSERSVAEVKVKLAKDTDKDFVLLRASDKIRALVPIDLEASSLVREDNIPEYVKAPIYEGDIIGSSKLYLMGELIGEVDLIAMETVERSFGLYLLDVLGIVISSGWFKLGVIVFILLLAFYLVLSVMLNNYKRRHRRSNVFSSGREFDTRQITKTRRVNRRKL